MSIFHSSLSRRDFMKTLGLGGVGLGAASLLAPTFHDFDELAAAPQGQQKRPWYVKEKELYNPSIDIDWSMMQRWDYRNEAHSAHTVAQYYDPTRVRNWAATGSAAAAAAESANRSGYTLRSQALRYGQMRASYAHTFANGPTDTSFSKVKTPAERGVAKWTGTPEEAASMLRAALRVYGASLVGYGPVDQQLRDKVVNSYSQQNSRGNEYIDNWPPPLSVSPKIVYENVDLGYEDKTAGKMVIPAKDMWYVSISLQGSNELFRSVISHLGNVANTATFYNSENLYASMWQFLRYLGYQSLGYMGDTQDPINHSAGGILSGLCEQSRANNYSFTPEYGPPGRFFAMITDLPLTPTNPIDSGMWRFCHSCHKCANHCPPSVISQDTAPTYDIPTLNGKQEIFHRPGPKAFWTDMAGCQLFSQETGAGCRTCWASCTFTVNHSAMVHQLVKGTITTTPIFNGFLFHMAENFGYGQKDPEAWWDKSLPPVGYDGSEVSLSGGYNK